MTMTKKIFKNIFLACFSMLVVTIVIIFGVMYNYHGKQIMNELHSEINIISVGVEYGGTKYLDTLSKSEKARITWVNKDGSIKYDSNVSKSKMENHLNRKEIKDAMKNGTGEDVRMSDTLSERTMYCAKLLSDGSVIRISTNQYTVWILLLNMWQPLAIVVIIALVLSYIIAYLSSKKIVMPINDLDLENVEAVTTYEEIEPLVHKISHQNRVIRDQIKELKRTQAEFNVITGNMKEGLLVLDLQGKILSYNKSVKKLLNISSLDDEYLEDLSIDDEFKTNINNAIHGTHMSDTFEYGDRYLSLYCNPVEVDGKIKGAVAVILDVTEKHQRELLRREFSANVSHELKTPLTAILASAEIIGMDSTPKETVTHFAHNITKEANRLITLVNDIIKLSKLDDKSYEPEDKEVDIYEIAKNVEDTLSPIADNCGVQLTLYGEKTIVHGVPTLLSEIVYNLVDNAIKYNKPNGSVTITVAPVNGKATLIVEDTGIGISKEDQSRIFERFYRVDKSHSKEVGGTGLGLSIVKHGVEHHNGKMKVESELGKGTKITIKF
ncbi:MAG: ATP-binding protein [Ruminococcus sp.]|nr:ATP-binding protein [Ruminococcus sp.]MCI5598929.1 ATP-binding protein [Ruminococcus sp.]